MPKKKTSADTVEVLTTNLVREFTEAELFYIHEKAKTTSPAEIAATLGATLEEIAVHLPDLDAAPTVDAKSSMMRDLMGKKSVSGQRDGVAIMTPSASQFADATRGTRIQGRDVNCIHKPLG